jgi:hypothetical protein
MAKRKQDKVTKKEEEFTIPERTSDEPDEEEDENVEDAEEELVIDTDEDEETISATQFPDDSESDEVRRNTYATYNFYHNFHKHLFLPQ